MNGAMQYQRSRVAILFLSSFTLVTSGCVTSRAIKSYEGDEAVLNFRLVSNEMPTPRIFWSESPPHAETMLTIRPAAPDCETVSIYVNPTPASQNLLGEKALSIAPAHLSVPADQLRQYIPEDRCAVLLLAGESDETGFSGVQYATAGGEFHKVQFDLARDRVKSKEEGLPAFMWPFAVFMVPVYATIAVVTVESAGLIPRKNRKFDHAVTVSFDFPDGRRKETVLSEDEAIDLLDGPLYHDGALLPADSFNSNFVRFWTRAALLKLELDFREEQVLQYSYEYDAEYLTPALVSVDGQDGEWIVDPRNGSQPSESLYTQIDNPRYIRCRLRDYQKDPAGLEANQN